MASSSSPSNYQQATAWLREANTAGDDRFGSTDVAKQEAWTAAAQVFALLAVADAVKELDANVTAALGAVERQFDYVTSAIDRLSS